MRSLAVLVLAAGLVGCSTQGEAPGVIGAPLAELEATAATDLATLVEQAATTTAAAVQPATSTMQPATTTTVAAQAPLHFEGVGDSAVRLDGLTTRAVIVKVAHDGTRNFAAWVYDASGQRESLLVNTIGAYVGTVIFDAYRGDQPVPSMIEVDADGAWSIDVLDLTEASRWDGVGPINGMGDSVFIAPGGSPRTAPMRWEHNGARNFAVHVFTDDEVRLVVNEIGAYLGTVVMPAGTFMVVVEADGGWVVNPV
jgi:hypothetical protein